MCITPFLLEPLVVPCLLLCLIVFKRYRVSGMVSFRSFNERDLPSKKLDNLTWFDVVPHSILAGKHNMNRSNHQASHSQRSIIFPYHQFKFFMRKSTKLHTPSSPSSLSSF